MAEFLTYGGKAPDARTVLVYGNCQSPYLAQFLGGIDDLGDDYRFVVVFNHGAPGEVVPPVPDAYMKSAVLLFEQYDERKVLPVRDDMRARLPPGCPTISYPSLMMPCMWPFDCPDPRRTPEPRFPWGRFAYGDAAGLMVAQQGLRGEGAFDAYMEISTTRMPDLAVRLQRDIDRLRNYDSVCDVPVADYVIDGFRHSHMFWTWGHTASAPLAELSRRMAEAARPVLGGHGERAHSCIAAIAATYEGIGGLQVPIHPLVASTLGLTFWREDTRYLWFDQRWTFREYIERYIAYDTDW